ncbi:MAG: hypothetical protein ACHQD9_02635 [Chitinophagales bacterium]
MKRMIKVIMASLVILFTAANFSRAAVNDENPKLKIGTSVNLSEQNVVWHKGNDYVIAYGKRDYLVKTDDDGKAIVVDRVSNLTDFIQSNGVTYVTRPAQGFYGGFYYDPWYFGPSVVVRAPIVGHPYPIPYHRVVVIHPRRTRL